MDGKAFAGFFGFAFVAIGLLPLGLWKLFEIGYWVASNLHWGTK